MATQASLATALQHAQRGDNARAQAILVELLEAPGHRDAPQAATLLGRLRLQAHDVDGALDALVPAWERARRGPDSAAAALVGLGLVQALVTADRALHGLRVLVQARRLAEVSGNPALLKASADLGQALLERMPSPADAETADSRTTRRHLMALAFRCVGDLPRSRAELHTAWSDAEAAHPAVRAEVGIDLVHRMQADGHPGWVPIRDAARKAAAQGGDTDLVQQFDAIEAPAAAPELPDDATDLDVARAAADAGQLQPAIAACERVLANPEASPGEALSARLLLAQLFLGADAADRAVAVLAPAWQAAEASNDAQHTAAVASLLGPALVADGRTLPGLRVLMVARHRASDDADLVASFRELGESIRRHVPRPEGDAHTPDRHERFALLYAAHGLLDWMDGEADRAKATMSQAWGHAAHAGPLAQAQVALDYTGMLRAAGDAKWEAVHKVGRASAMEVEDVGLMSLFDAIQPPPEA
mgnify:FL=1